MVDATRRDDVGPGATVREGEEHRAPGQPSQVLLRLPSALADRFEVERELQTRGNEADILVARDRSNGERFAIKLYRPGIAPKREVSELLASLDTNYVVQQFESGSSEGRAYEVMELAEGSLADLLVERKGKLTDTQLRSVIEQVTAHLEYIHGLQPKIVHRDIKPDNILMRTRTPLKFVLTDFGISSIVEHGSRVASSVSKTTFYAAPEAGAGDISAGLDWWSLGMIVAEAAGGRRPFGDALEQTVNIHFARREPIPLGAVTDARIKLLCQGLLCYDQKQRWGAAEVRRWLTGDPTLRAPMEAPARPVAAERAPRAYRIGGTDCWTLTELAAALVANWDEAVKRVARRNDIERWLLQDLQDQDAYNRFLDLNEDRAYQSLPPSAKLSLWLPMIEPSLAPMVDGRELTRERVIDYLSAGSEDRSRWPAILQPGYGERLAELTGAAWLSEIYTQWRSASAEARALDDQLRAAAPNLTALDTGGQVNLLRLVLDDSFRADAVRSLTEETRGRDVRACRWAAPLLKVTALPPAGLWVLQQRLGAAHFQGSAANELKRRGRTKRVIRSLVVGAFAICFGILVIQDINVRIKHNQFKNSQKQMELIMKPLRANLSATLNQGYDANIFSSSAPENGKVVNLFSLRPEYIIGSISRLAGADRRCSAVQIQLRVIDANCYFGQGIVGGRTFGEGLAGVKNFDTVGNIAVDNFGLEPPKYIKQVNFDPNGHPLDQHGVPMTEYTTRFERKTPQDPIVDWKEIEIVYIFNPANKNDVVAAAKLAAALMHVNINPEAIPPQKFGNYSHFQKLEGWYPGNARFGLKSCHMNYFYDERPRLDLGITCFPVPH